MPDHPKPRFMKWGKGKGFGKACASFRLALMIRGCHSKMQVRLGTGITSPPVSATLTNKPMKGMPKPATAIEMLWMLAKNDSHWATVGHEGRGQRCMLSIACSTAFEDKWSHVEMETQPFICKGFVDKAPVDVATKSIQNAFR